MEAVKSKQTLNRRAMQLIIALIASAALISAFSSSASALTYGLGWSGSYGGTAAEMDVLGHSGASTIRVSLDISVTNGGADWSTYDSIFENAWKNGLTIQPILIRSNGQGTRFLLSSDPGWSGWYTWVKQAVRRYGMQGDFWNGKSNPKPVTAWEIWNEPNLFGNNPIVSQNTCKNLGQAYSVSAGTCVQPQHYGDFLVYTAVAVQTGQQEKTGGTTTILFGGLYTPGGDPYSNFLNKAYSVPGVYSSYHGMSIHPYGFDPTHTNGDKNIAEVQTQVNGVRATLNNLPWGPSRSLWITELGWPLNSFGNPNFPAVQSEQEQADLLNESMDWIQQEAGAKNIVNLVWYNTRDINVPNWAYSCGLRNEAGDFRPQWFAFQQQTGAPMWPLPETIQGEDTNLPGPHAVAQSNGTVDAFFRNSSGGLGHAWTQGGSWSEQGIAETALKAGSVPHPVVRQNNGTIDVFWRTPSNGLGHAFNAGQGWFANTLPGTLASEPHAVVQDNGVIDVFYRTPEGKLGHAWYVPGGPWNSNTLPGSVASDPYPVAQDNGAVDVFFRTPQGKLGHAWTQGLGWSEQDISETSLNSASTPHPIIQDNGTIDVFWRTPSNGLGHAFYAGQGWFANTLPGTLASEPHPVVQSNGTIDVFYRTPDGKLGHNWYLSGGSWYSGTISSSVSSDPYPTVQNNGVIDVFWRTPSGGLAHAWTLGTGWSEGTLPGSVATGPQAVALWGGVVEVLYRNPESKLGHSWWDGGGWYSNTLPGSVSQGDATGEKLSAMPVTQAFNGSAPSIASFASNWTALGWASGATPKGEDTATGWRPVSAHPTVNGASYNTTVTDSGSGIAASATMAVSPGSSSRYFSIWLDLQTPASTKAGYELRFTYTSANTYTLTLSKWQAGSQSELAKNTGYSFAAGSSVALVDQGDTVSAWTSTGSGFNELLSATDATFSSGKTGIEGAGNITRLTNFKAGSL